MIVRGQLKVDARMAASKIRDHLLTDLELYACEVARAASAFGATWLDVDWDAQDVVLTCDGTPPPLAELARARDHVLGAAADETTAGLRLLGIGLSAALGLEPAFVEVLARDGAVRFEAGDAAPQQRDSTEALGEGTLRVRVRRRLGLELLKRALRPDPPRAVRYLQARAWPSPLRVRVLGVPLDRAPQVLQSRSVASGVRIELLTPDVTAARTAFVERGIELVSYDFLGSPNGTDIDGLPLRVVVESNRLPTNASRSEIRLDAPGIVSSLSGVPAALDELLLASRDLPSLGAVAAWAFWRLGRGELATPGLHALLDLPLLRDGGGRPLTLRALYGLEVVLLHVGETPLPEEVLARLPVTVWPRQHPAERALSYLNTVRAEGAVEMANVGLARRDRARARPPTSVSLPSEAYGHREEFRVTAGAFAGLRGEIGLRAGELAHRRVHWFVDGRRLEISDHRAETHLSFDVALAWDGVVQADLAYERVQHTTRTEAALAYASCVAAVIALERIPDLAAVRSWLRASAALGVTVPPVDALSGALLEAKVWATSDGRTVSLADLRAASKASGVLCTSMIRTRPAPDARPVVLTSELELLQAFLPDTRFVPYGQWLGAASTWLEPEPEVSVRFENAWLRGYVTLGSGTLHLYHAGNCVLSRPYESQGGKVDVYVDAPGLVPDPAGKGFVGKLVIGHFRDVEAELLEHVLQRLEAGAFDAAPPSLLAKFLADSSGVAASRLGAAKRRLRGLKDQKVRAAFLARPEQHPATAPGAITARLRAAGEARPKQRVYAHGRLLQERALIDLPVALEIHLDGEEHVNAAWTGLTQGGTSQVVQSARTAILDLLSKRFDEPGSVDDQAALELAAALLPDASAEMSKLVRRQTWPTVAGDRTTLPEPGPVRIGQELHAPYVRGEDSSWDVPTLYAPSTPLGHARRTLLQALGYQLDDVTSALATIQSQRAHDGGDRARWVDTMGREHTLGALLAIDDVHYTTNPEDRGVGLAIDDRPVLLLDPMRASELAVWLRETRTKRRLVDVTDRLDAERRGAIRRAQPALEAVELTREMRLWCRKVVRIDWKREKIRGELGLLDEAHASQRGLWLYVEGRLLCRIDDAAGEWPTLARLEIGGRATTAAFDGLQRYSDEERLVRLLATTVSLQAKELVGAAEPPGDPVALPPPLPSRPPPPLPSRPPPPLPSRPPPLPSRPPAPTHVARRPEPRHVVVEELPEEPESFFAHLFRRALAAVRSTGPEAPVALEAVAEALTSFALPVRKLSGTSSGRPVRYVPAEQRVLVNVHAAALRTQADSMQIALAAVSEINRELGEVTDADEREIVQKALAELARGS